MKTSPMLKIIAGLLLAAVLVYFGFQIYDYFDSPFSTTLAYMSTVEDSVSADGYLVREEEVLPSSGGALRLLHSEGDKVGIGQTLAVSYSSQDDLKTVEHQQQQFALSTYLDADAALKLDSTIASALATLQSSLQSGDYSAAEEESNALKAQILKRDYSAASQEEIEAQVQTTQAQIDALNASLSGAAVITAPRSGTYSAVCDGYETVLTPDMLSDITPSALHKIAAGGTDSDVGKLITASTWYYAVTMPAADAGRFEAGDSVTLRLSKGLSRDVSARVSSVGAEEDGACVVVFSCSKYLAQTTLLRQVSGELVLATYEGLRVPSAAIRVNAEGTSGVYCMVGVTARFKPVEIVYQSGEFCLVRAAILADTTTLRAGDEVIVTAENLTEGQIIR